MPLTDAESGSGRDEYHFDRVQAEAVEEANLLLDFAVERGIPSPPGDVEVIRASVRRQPSRDLNEDFPAREPHDAAPSEGFEQAYARLASQMWPVTARSLRATARADGSPSEAERWSLRIGYVTVVVLVALVIVGLLDSYSSPLAPIDEVPDDEFPEGPSRFVVGVTGSADLLFPFLFGALGACAYLLRKCHETIYLRTFDPKRKHEYLSRILLGFISGGAGGVLFAPNS